jgi:predicted TIM-barrel fold metal-dependent hydrolase
MDIIDAHANICPKGNWINEKGDATIESLEKQMAQTGTEKAVLISTPGISDNQYIKKLLLQKPKVYRAFAQLNFNEDIIDQSHEILSGPYSGIKLHPRLQNIDLTEKSLVPFWTELNAKNAKVLIDGFPKGATKGLSIAQQLPLYYENLVRTYTNITFIYAHAGFQRVMDTYMMCRSYPNFYTNTSFSQNLIENKGPLQAEFRYLIENCDKKTMFGSDYPEYSIGQALKAFNQITKGQARNKIENVLHNTATHLLWT